jgi:hypothetical protein
VLVVVVMLLFQNQVCCAAQDEGVPHLKEMKMSLLVRNTTALLLAL